MDERAATHRRLYYTITEVQLLLSLAAVLCANSLALVGQVTSVLSSAPRLLHFGMRVLGLAGDQLRMVYALIAITLRRSSQADAAYSNRTWRDYKNNRDFRRDFRFDRDHIPRLIAALQLPASIRSGGYCFTADDAISVLLFMLANDATLVKVNQKLGIKRAKASVIFRWTVHWLRDRWYKPLFVTDFHRWLPCFEEWARAALHVQGGNADISYTGIIAFIDGTLIATCRPAPWLQRAFYSGYKKQHGVHWQGCLAPMGLIIDLAGPFEGRHSDKWMLNVSEICERLKAALQWAVNAGRAPVGWLAGMLYFFTDGGYNRRLLLHTIFQKPAGGELTAAQEEINRRLSKTRIANEWIYGRIGALWPYVATKKKMAIGRGTPGSTYVVAALLTNALTCLEGNNTSKYFNLTPPSLEDYFGLAPAAASCPRAWYENVDKYDQTDA
jgi:hypothetical protein